MKVGDWVVSMDEEWQFLGYPTKDEAVAAAKAALELEPGDQFFVGRVTELALPEIHTDDLLEQLGDQVSGGEAWPEAEPKQVEELHESLNAALAAWCEKHTIAPAWFNVDDVEELISP